MMTTYTEVTKTRCACRRDVAVVKVRDGSGPGELKVSRHLAPGGGFCAASLDPYVQPERR